MENMRIDCGGSVSRWRKFFVKEDPIYDRWEVSCQPRTASGRVAYFALYFIPGLVMALAINVSPIFAAELRFTHLSPRYLQFDWLLVIALGWHLLSPFFFLRVADGLTFRDSLSFLGFDRIDLGVS